MGSIAVVIGIACSDVEFVEIERETTSRDDRFAIGGTLCTRTPDTRVTPLRVIFVVDSSDSMAVSDPPDPFTLESGRQRAVRETWEELLDGDPEAVRISIVRFSSEAQGSTAIDEDGDNIVDTYFTADRAVLAAATDRLGITNRTTNYATALAEAFLEIRTELQQADEESLPLSRYVVVFLSDGLPDGDRNDAAEEAIDGVNELLDLTNIFRVGTFEFHTAYLSSGLGPELDREAQELLQEMAEVGGGTFRNFPSGESINFLFVNLTSIRSVFTISGMSAFNLNSVTDIDQIQAIPVP
ncbi:MAG: vWA domain-containing protein, partial [Myxococcota bacterium]